MQFWFCSHKFFTEARELEKFLKSLTDIITRKYSCDKSTSLTKVEDLLQDSMVRTPVGLATVCGA